MSHAPNDFARIQADTVSLHAKTLLPVLFAHAHPATAADRQAIDMLRQWNFDATADSAAMAMFAAWFHQLAPAIVGDELGPATLASYRTRFTFITRFVIDTLRTNAGWCDNVVTPERETCDDAVTLALHNGVVDMTRRLGTDMARWRWGAVHGGRFSTSGARRGGCAATVAQPLGTERRGLEHRERRAGRGGDAVRAAFGPGLPPHHRSLGSQ